MLNWSDTAVLLLAAAAAAAQAQEMPKTVPEALALEQADRLPITDFYATPEVLPATKPGALLRKDSHSTVTRCRRAPPRCAFCIIR